jgi:hypothetical protein
MDAVIAWVTFAGAWLLVAGPLYQGSVELNELDVDREGIQGKAVAAQETQARPSAWWWLLPPVMYVLHRRWYRALRQEMLAQLTPTQREQLTSFQSKTTGWFTVAAGATLLAVGETWQVVRHYDWPVWVFWLLIVVMLSAAVLSTAVFMIGAARSAATAGLSRRLPLSSARPAIGPSAGGGLGGRGARAVQNRQRVLLGPSAGSLAKPKTVAGRIW